MQLVSLEMIETGTTLAKTIYDEEGRIMLKAGAILRTEYLERLKNLGFTGVYIQNDFTDSLELTDVVSEGTRVEAYKAVRVAIQEVCQGSGLATREIMNSIRSIMDEIINNHKVLLTLNDLRMTHTYALSHAVSVCILSLLLGLSLGYDQLKLKQLGIGALLHDIGKAKLPQPLLEKTLLTGVEEAELKRHCEIGFNVIRNEKEISIMAAHVAFQHHERYDGSGFPRNLHGEQISEFARIVSVADTYDNLTHDRPGEQRRLPHEAIRMMINEMKAYFDPKMLTLLVRNIAIYPVGLLVKLNTGEVGVVIKTKKEQPIKPTIKVVGEGSQGMASETVLDLTERKDKFIIEVLEL